MNVWAVVAIGVVCVAAFIIILAVLYNAGMVWLAGRFSGKTMEKQLAVMEGELPGTDCGQCGCESCRAYAYAVFTCHKEADLCVPGGPEVEEKLKAHMMEFEKLLLDERERKKDKVKQMEKGRDD